MTTMIHGEINHLFVKSGLVLGEPLLRSGVELIAAKPQLSRGSTAVHRCCPCPLTPIWIY